MSTYNFYLEQVEQEMIDQSDVRDTVANYITKYVSPIMAYREKSCKRKLSVHLSSLGALGSLFYSSEFLKTPNGKIASIYG